MLSLFHLISFQIIHLSSSFFLMNCGIRTNRKSNYPLVSLLPFIFVSCSRTLVEVRHTFFVWNNYFIYIFSLLFNSIYFFLHLFNFIWFLLYSILLYFSKFIFVFLYLITFLLVYLLWYFIYFQSLYFLHFSCYGIFIHHSFSSIYYILFILSLFIFFL